VSGLFQQLRVSEPGILIGPRDGPIGGRRILRRGA
jgi:hypothetical protein